MCRFNHAMFPFPKRFNMSHHFLLFICSFSIGLKEMESTSSRCTASTPDIMWERTTIIYRRLGPSACASYWRVSETSETHCSARAGNYTVIRWLFFLCDLNLCILYRFISNCRLSPQLSSVFVVAPNHHNRFSGLKGDNELMCYCYAYSQCRLSHLSRINWYKYNQIRAHRGL